ncbi:hypothetical protein CC1G_15462 [Coprinopsis cinerea okayama7|uniref:DNA endonuclease activator Ctp1 C-terminal domain-containing protein n=1 Tax=Coprinopsis cinerea (strain Okayama-7 / 130 / ATCC MYA-4618 / FGSC 9003) TaxID=240176 RepID=D6RQQ4_COPC7|nr:hypothetical protein CC1G_15462 [Coprinopsis cinerea okayama7\|eukprot:XP_002910185.1 hypothetical protein CC1G_15462 [Coprinopsis cinerea okayama7\
MNTDNGAFSSAKMKERDKRIEERHQKEISALERKIDNIRRSNDDVRKQMFDVVQRSNRLVHSLGFENAFEAQEALDLVDNPTSFKGTLERVQSQEKELRDLRGHLEELEGRCSELSSENEFLKLQNGSLTEKLRALEDKYQRAGEFYKRDYAKWKTFARWSASEDTRHRRYRNEKGISSTEKIRRDTEHFARRSEKMKETIPDFERFTKDYEEAFEAHVKTPRPPSKGLPMTSSSTTAVPSVQRPSRLDQLSRSEHDPPSASPTIFLKDSDDPAVSSDTEPDPQPPFPNSQPPLRRSGTFKLPRLPQHVSYSSDTEEESISLTQQIADLSGARASIHPSSPCKDSMASSDTEDSQFGSPFAAAKSTPLSSSSGSNARRPLEPLSFSERPSKIRRVDGTDDVDDMDSATPRRRDENSRPLPRTEPMKGPVSRLLNVKGPSEKARRAPRHSEPGLELAAPSASATKGKGRYAPRRSEPGPSSSTINAKFVIDPAKNNGVGHQYDEVVRGREARRQMDAGDCECCREYYNAVGPLPPRPPGLLWASPSSTPKRCKHRAGKADEEDEEDHETPTRRQKDIDAHKKGISRHRHNWERAKTPPDYWNIGFPNTQEVGEINERAEQMHRQKFMDIEREVASGSSRYKRRH